MNTPDNTNHFTPKLWPCSRLDVVGQFIINPRDVITAHRECSHPAIRKGKVYYEGESLAFRGKERLCRMYDKIKEATGKPGTVTRVEWQLRGDSLRRDFGPAGD